VTTTITESVTTVKKIPVLQVKLVPTIPKLENIQEKKFTKCMILYSSEEDNLSKPENEFCEQIMKACGLTQNEYEQVNFYGLKIEDIKERYEFNKLLLFGVDIPKLNIDKYKCTLMNSTYIISGDPLWMLKDNNGLKTFLWKQLQLMFGIVK
jgi:hypothetical protein